jgi:hypothetical protein
MDEPESQGREQRSFEDELRLLRTVEEYADGLHQRVEVTIKEAQLLRVMRRKLVQRSQLVSNSDSIGAER